MNEFESKFGFSLDEWESCIKVLKQLKNTPFENPDNQLFGTLLTKIHKNAKKQSKKQEMQEDKAADARLLKSATIAKNALNKTTFYGPQSKEEEPFFTDLKRPQNCYACNEQFQSVHSFYHRLCPSCAVVNYNFRHLKLDLSNRNVLLTGGRVKIGYAASLMFLRNQANLTITTRFPALALEQFKQEADYLEWKDRLTIYGLDLRNLRALETFLEDYKSKYDCLDILVNNAAQTIKYTESYYQPLCTKETQLLAVYKEEKQLTGNTTPVVDAAYSLNVVENSIELSSTNRFGLPIDRRDKNSWNSTLEEISTQELLEVNLINHIAPYMMIKTLTPLLKASPFVEKFIINVTSSEGQFSYGNKTIFHPHTNMTKAALNMMTRTSAKAYAKEGIYMNSVDVGWVSTGAHEKLREKQFEAGYIPPLDSVDGAARILHPIYEVVVNKFYLVGHLLKNYEVSDW